jgi:hypothetical protein
MKMKHNKKRNTAFIFEALVRELTKAVVEGDVSKKKKIVNLIRNNFKGNNLLSKDLRLYKSIMELKDADKELAERVIFEARMERNSIDNKKLFEEQSEIINKINKEISPDVFSNFVPNYKDLATISQIFNSRMKARDRILLEREMVGKMMSLEESKDSSLKPIDNLTYKTFVKKFNEKYNQELANEQKELLKRYITSFEDDGIELKVFLNEEISRLKEILSDSLKLEEIKSDEVMLENTKKVYDMLVNANKRDIDKVLVQDILKIQNLAREINE